MFKFNYKYPLLFNKKVNALKNITFLNIYRFVFFCKNKSCWSTEFNFFLSGYRFHTNMVTFYQLLFSFRKFFFCISQIIKERRQILYVNADLSTQNFTAKFCDSLRLPHVTIHHWIVGIITNWKNFGQDTALAKKDTTYAALIQGMKHSLYVPDVLVLFFLNKKDYVLFSKEALSLNIPVFLCQLSGIYPGIDTLYTLPINLDSKKKTIFFLSLLYNCYCQEKKKQKLPIFFKKLYIFLKKKQKNECASNKLTFKKPKIRQFSINQFTTKKPTTKPTKKPTTESTKKPTAESTTESTKKSIIQPSATLKGAHQKHTTQKT